MITTFNLFTSIAWISAGIISIIISVLFLMKNPKKRLNQLFSAGFIGWSLSLFFNGLNFAVAQRSLLLANIFRDTSVVTGILGALILTLATIGIYFGAEALHWALYVVTGVLIAIMAIFGTLNDWVVEDLDMGGYKTTDNWLGKSFVQIIPSTFVMAGLVLLILTYFKLENKIAKKRMGFYTIGFSTILIGVFMFVIDSFINLTPYLFPTLAVIAWVMGPVLMLAGFYVKVEADPKHFPENRIGLKESKTLDPKQKIERPS